MLKAPHIGVMQSVHFKNCLLKGEVTSRTSSSAEPPSSCHDCWPLDGQMLAKVFGVMLLLPRLSALLTENCKSTRKRHTYTIRPLIKDPVFSEPELYFSLKNTESWLLLLHIFFSLTKINDPTVRVPRH